MHDQQNRVSRTEQGIFKLISWSFVKVGQVVKVRRDEYFPADIVLINSNDPQGIWYVETKNLDGETNLKYKTPDTSTIPFTKNDEDMSKFKGEIKWQEPNEFLYKFEGALKFKPPKTDQIESFENMEGEYVNAPLTANQLLLRGSCLRNTDYIYGIVVYTGHDSKIMKNSPSWRNKLSKIEKKTNILIIFVFLIQISIWIFASLYQTTWNHSNKEGTNWYLGWYINEQNIDKSIILSFLVGLGSWWLIFWDFVPISLLVTLEFIKFFQAIFMFWEANMFDENKNMYMRVQSSNLTEELGQVEYIFSDKTGTLTQNIMEFRKMWIGNFCYGKGSTSSNIGTSSNLSSDRKDTETEEAKDNNKDWQISDFSQIRDVKKDTEITNVRFNDPTFYEHIDDPAHENYEMIHRFLIHLAICHTVIIDKHMVNEEEKITFNASSPDELALVNAARKFGYFFWKRDENNNIIITLKSGKYLKYHLLNVIEFDSTRKRMSVVIRWPDNSIKVLCKGADSVIYERLKSRHYVKFTEQWLENFAKEGLRTLLLAEKEITDEEYEDWADKYNSAALLLENREERMFEIAEEIETDFELIGATAVEDRLQDDVADTISLLKAAGIKIWVLTGDKIETAINIGYSWRVLNNDMHLYLVDGQKTSEIVNQIANFIKEYKNNKNNQHALIVSGDSLVKITSHEKVWNKFMALADKMNVVIAWRVSPKQKSEIVLIMKNRFPDKTTLAIGDGANDVNMITTADVGVGISGVEGQQASRVSDFAIGQFKFLKPLLFVHGRESYRKISYTVGYMFYK